MSRQLFLYIAKQFLPLFIFCNLIILFILVMFQVLSLAELVVGKGAGIIEVSLIIGLFMISFLPASIPISTLTASNMIVGRMSLDSELIALVTSGIPVRVVLKYFVLLAFPITLLTYWLSMVGAPRASQKVNDMLATLQVRSLAVTVKPGVFIENFHGMILYAESMDTQSDDLKNVFLYDERDNRMPMIVMGRRVDSLQQGEDHMQLTFHDGEIHVNRRDGSYQRVLFDDYRISIPVDLSEQKGIRSTLSMTQDELREEMKQLGSGHPFGSELRARYISFMLEYKRRFTIPLIPMIFVVLGTLWGCGHYRNMRGRPILISLIMSIGYWSIFLLVDGYARKETIPVNIAIWLPNIICILFCYQIFRVRRIYV